MMTALQDGLYAILLAVACFYALAPAIIHRTSRHRVYAEYAPLNLEQLAPDIALTFKAAARQLREHGFAPVLLYEAKQQVRHASTIVWLWTNIRRGQTAVCACIMSDLGGNKFHVEFGTIVVPLQVIDTSNTRSATIFETVEWHDVCHLPWVDDLSELYQVHLRRERDLVPVDATRFVPAPGTEVQVLQDAMAFTMRSQVKRGVYVEREVGEFQFTWFGAYLVCMRLLPPMKQVRQFLKLRRSKRQFRRALAEPVQPLVEVNVTTQSPFTFDSSTEVLPYG